MPVIILSPVLGLHCHLRGPRVTCYETRRYDR